MQKLGFDMLIQREPSSETQTLGTLTCYADQIKPIFDCKSLELEVDENQKRDDAIPCGTYDVIKRTSPKYGEHFHVLDVVNRSFILIHNANFSFQILGCIAVGKTHQDINKDGLKDVTSSKQTMKKLLAVMPDKFVLKIVQNEV